MNNVKCLNPWDVQSKHVVLLDGTSESLCAGEKRWGSLPPNVLYEVKNEQCEMSESMGSSKQTAVSD